MIDFKTESSFLKLTQTTGEGFISLVTPILISDEHVISAYKTIRDGVIFTNKRIIAINTQGITGKKKDFTSMPYSKILTYSIETAGVFDLDSELEIWFSEIGKVRFEFLGSSNAAKICKIISEYALR